MKCPALFLALSIFRTRGRALLIPIPLYLLYEFAILISLVLAPLALLRALFTWRRPLGPNFFRGVALLWEMLTTLRGFEVNVNEPKLRFRLTVI